MFNHSGEEDKWFKEHEQELIAEAKERKKIEEEKEQKEIEEALKQLHYNHCPKCGHKLADFELDGVPLNRCLRCKGLWLDNGELETLVKKEAEQHFLGRLLRAFY